MPPKKLRNVPRPVCGYCSREGICPHCDGEGLITALQNTLPHEYLISCEECNGTGRCPMCGESAIISKPTPKGGE